MVVLLFKYIIKLSLSIDMNYLDCITHNQNIVKNKIITNFGCDSMKNINTLKTLGANFIYCVDSRRDVFDKLNLISNENIEFVLSDLTDVNSIINKSQTILVSNTLSLIRDHLRFFQTILKPHIEYCLIETDFSNDSYYPEIIWRFSDTDHYDSLQSPVSVPNLPWIIESASIFDFNCDWVYHYGNKSPKPMQLITNQEYNEVAGSNWPPYEQLIQDENVPKLVKAELNKMLFYYPRESRRVVLRLYNTNLITAEPLDLKDIHFWPY